MGVLKWIIVAIVLLVFWSSAYVLDASNRIGYIKKEFKRMQIGDKYCRFWYGEKEMRKNQKGKKIYAIITDKKESKKLSECVVFYDYYEDDVLVSKGASMKIYKSMFKFFDNWKRPDVHSCIMMQWEKKYKGEPWY